MFGEKRDEDRFAAGKTGSDLVDRIRWIRDQHNPPVTVRITTA